MKITTGYQHLQKSLFTSDEIQLQSLMDGNMSLGNSEGRSVCVCVVHITCVSLKCP